MSISYLLELPTYFQVYPPQKEYGHSSLQFWMICKDVEQFKNFSENNYDRVIYELYARGETIVHNEVFPEKMTILKINTLPDEESHLYVLDMRDLKNDKQYKDSKEDFDEEEDEK